MPTHRTPKTPRFAAGGPLFVRDGEFAPSLLIRSDFLSTGRPSRHCRSPSQGARITSNLLMVPGEAPALL